MSKIKIITWNLGGICARAENGGLYNYLVEHDADIYCFQETRTKSSDAESKCLSVYNAYACEAKIAKYGGLVNYFKQKPISLSANSPEPMNEEGRLIVFEYEAFYLINIYLPNDGDKKQNRESGQKWRNWLNVFVKHLDTIKPIIICGDLNIATYYKESRRKSENRGSAGHELKDRQYLQNLLDLGFTNVLDHQYKTEAEMLTHLESTGDSYIQDYFYLDYILVSNRLADKIISAEIHTNMRRHKSHHLPLEVVMQI